ncbi:hypothetical protein [Sphingobacterium sp. SYP-B4668]|uniref:hypothetical protein n=1 Tax=Sphingobacterium sp. SYP-B4668 TaxID=2996035 RepID=UPI0022DD561A|nr:hypothetical protein [Sphingobacterium sp. SYP-B4668]
MTNEAIQYLIIGIVFIGAIIFLYKKMRGSSKGSCGCSTGGCCGVNTPDKRKRGAV